MPRRDGTGPAGAGAMSGRGMGNCTTKAFASNVTGRGIGIGRGNRGCGRQAFQGNNTRALEDEIVRLHKRLDEIDKK
ncbi:MAG: DUF5320 domain-containing protein [Bacilli bacterium]|nr:DUF5320 domain-containing protein [Bacilli bacterium]